MADRVFSIRIPEDLRLRLEEAAAEGDRSAGQEARRAIKAWLAAKINDAGPLNEHNDEKVAHSAIESAP